MPLIIFPQLLTCGLFVARDHMVSVLYHFSDFMPMTYSVDAMKHIAHETTWGTTITHDFIIVVLCALGALVLGAVTIKRHD